MTDNLGWEKAVLGTALANPAAMGDTDELYPSDFTGCHAVLFAEMLDLHRRGALDIRALVESLRTRNLLETIGDPLSDLGNFATGEAYLADLLSHRGDAMPEYASQVLSASVRRELKQAAAFIRVEAEDTGTPVEDVLDSAERRLTTLQAKPHLRERAIPGRHPIRVHAQDRRAEAGDGRAGLGAGVQPPSGTSWTTWRTPTS